MTNPHIVTPGQNDEEPPTWDAYHAASRAVERHRERADRALRVLAELVDGNDCTDLHDDNCPQHKAKELLAAERIEAR